MRRPTKHPLEVSLDGCMQTLPAPVNPCNTIVLYDASALVEYKATFERFLRTGVGRRNCVVGSTLDEVGGGFARKLRQGPIQVFPSTSIDNALVEAATCAGEQTRKHLAWGLVRERLECGTRSQAHNNAFQRAYTNVYRNGEDPTPEAIQTYVDKRWQVSQGDINVVAAGLQFADKSGVDHVVLMARDSHISESVLLLQNPNRSVYSDLARQIRVVSNF